MTQFSYVIFLAAVFAGCDKKVLENPTDAFASAQRLGKMSNRALWEVSGLAASPANPGYLWVVNDSGNDASVLLVDTSLHVRMTCVLAGIENRDWEDVVAGPGPDPSKHYLYAGDIGDNKGRHTYSYIYRFEEPPLRPVTGDAETPALEITDFDTITFRLPDGPKDMEALFMDRRTKDLYLVSKREEPVYLYRLAYPHSEQDTLVAEKIMALPLTSITAADLSPDGNEIVMKNYEHVYYWTGAAPTSVVSLLAQQPFEVPYEEEPQGEAMTWALDGSGFYTLSEHPLAGSVYLYFYKHK
jgi:hypothetical protein